MTEPVGQSPKGMGMSTRDIARAGRRMSAPTEKERLAQALRDGDQETFTEAVRKVNRPTEPVGQSPEALPDPRHVLHRFLEPCGSMEGTDVCWWCGMQRARHPQVLAATVRPPEDEAGLRAALTKIADWQTHGPLLGIDADAMVTLARAALAAKPPGDEAGLRAAIVAYLDVDDAMPEVKPDWQPTDEWDADVARHRAARARLDAALYRAALAAKPDQEEPE